MELSSVGAFANVAVVDVVVVVATEAAIGTSFVLSVMVETGVPATVDEESFERTTSQGGGE